MPIDHYWHTNINSSFSQQRLPVALFRKDGL